MYRQDLDPSDPLVVLETKEEKKAFECLKALEKEWTESAKEQRPFRLTSPHKEVFVSSLIIKITVMEMSLEDYKVYKDPMQQQLSEKGFTETMNQWGWNSN